MQDKTNILEEAVRAALSHLGEIRRVGDLEIDPSQTPAGIWLSVKSEEPVCNRQRLTVTFYVRTHADSDPERKRIDALSSALVQAASVMKFENIPDAAILPVSGGDYSMEDDFHVQTFNQIIHIREV